VRTSGHGDAFYSIQETRDRNTLEEQKRCFCPRCFYSIQFNSFIALRFPLFLLRSGRVGRVGSGRGKPSLGPLCVGAKLEQGLEGKTALLGNPEELALGFYRPGRELVMTVEEQTQNGI
jgi:hypothetical protein